MAKQFHPRGHVDWVNGVNFHKMIMMLIMATTMMISTSVTMLIGWMVGASTKAGKAGSVQAIKVSLGRDSPVVTWDFNISTQNSEQ